MKVRCCFWLFVLILVFVLVGSEQRDYRHDVPDCVWCCLISEVALLWEGIECMMKFPELVCRNTSWIANDAKWFVEMICRNDLSKLLGLYQSSCECSQNKRFWLLLLCIHKFQRFPEGVTWCLGKNEGPNVKQVVNWCKVIPGTVGDLLNKLRMFPK